MSEELSHSQHSKPTVLLIDDDADVLSSLCRILKMRGYATESATSISEALERDDWHRFQAGIFDRNLPDGMIEDALPMIRQKAPDLAIIIATGYADLEGTIKALQAKVDDYLIKPVSPDLLTNRLEKVAEEHTQREEICRLKREVLRTAEEEKCRISLEIHDGLASMLCGISMLARSLSRSLEKKGLDKEVSMSTEIEEHLKGGINQARTLAHQLCAIGNHPNDLSAALRELAGTFDKDRDHDCRCNWSGEVPVNDPIAAHHLFRIAQEAVSNAVRHGEASRIELTLADHDNTLELRIVDDGCGFDENETNFTTGLGLRSMLYRANAMGATLTFEQTGNDHGTAILCVVPKDSLHPQDNFDSLDEVG